MVHHIPDILKQAARELRKNMTSSEKKLWDTIRWDKLWERILRQKVFYVYTEDSGLNRFIIPDFYIASKKFIIEVDGGIHKLSEILKLDKVKEELIIQKWFNFIRITNNEIEQDIEKVITKIKQKLI